MLRKKGFTLVEMMVVILIVAILATAAVPILRGQIDKAKWSEGKTFMGTIATGIRTYIALEDPGNLAFADKDSISFAMLGLDMTDFNGKYFTPGHFDWMINYVPGAGLTYEVSGFAAGTTITYPQVVTLDQNGKWVEN